jgi:6-pyruvoyl-tetrahydropterin synthase
MNQTKIQDRKSMFLRNFTAVDYAFINPDGVVRGDSFHVNATVSGAMDPNEHVVVDFSTVKKALKDVFDAKEDGFDHKLWLIDGLSNVMSIDKGDVIEITTPETFLYMPTNAVKFIKSFETKSMSIVEIVEKQANAKLNKMFPESDIRVKFEFHNRDFSRPGVPGATFNYVHGLKDSTSWGCQNHSHGHSSFIEFDLINSPSNMDAYCQSQLARMIAEIDSAVFIYDENVLTKSDRITTIVYETERGFWMAKYNTDAYSLIIMEKETTVENLTEWFIDRNYDVLADLGVERVHMSEGLTKGAVQELN